MKKTLLATTLLVATAGLAAAEVNLSGSGRFGIIDKSSAVKTIIDTRLTFNIDAKMETDGGVTFGGRIRFRYNDGQSYTWGSPAMLYMETSGLRVEVGNANGAYDSAGLIWNSEIGLTDSSYGDPNNVYYGYFENLDYGNANQMGIFASYSMGDLTARVSYHVANQNINNSDDETSISLDWSSNGFSVSAAYVTGTTGVTEETTFIGAAYAIGDSTNVGLNYFTGDAPDLVTLYANHTMANGLTLAGYVADQDTYDTAFGIGASYPLGGGAAIKAAYHDRGADNFSEFGVTFSF
jgi:outer membrane protein OmpU